MAGTLIATPARDDRGRFRRSQAAVQAEIAAAQMRARLEREVPAAEHARGVVYEKPHYRKLPGYVPPVDEGEGDLGPVTLFDRRIAA